MKTISKNEILAFVSAAGAIGYVVLLEGMILINRKVLGSAPETGNEFLQGKFSDGNNIFYWSMGDNFEHLNSGMIFQSWICDLLDKWLDNRPKFDPDESLDLGIAESEYRGGDSGIEFAGDFDFILIDYSDFSSDSASGPNFTISDFIKAGENQVAILLPDNPGLVVESIAMYLTSVKGYQLS